MAESAVKAPVTLGRGRYRHRQDRNDLTTSAGELLVTTDGPPKAEPRFHSGEGSDPLLRRRRYPRGQPSRTCGGRSTSGVRLDRPDLRSVLPRAATLHEVATCASRPRGSSLRTAFGTRQAVTTHDAPAEPLTDLVR